MVLIDLRVWVKPGSRKGPLVEAADATSGRGVDLVVYLQERAVDGKANQALIGILAAHFAVPVGAVSILGGHASRAKKVRIADGA